MAGRIAAAAMDAIMTGKLLDSTVLIDLSRGNITAAEFIDSERSSGTALFVSVISAMELVTGCRNKDEVAKVKQLVAEFALLQLLPVVSAKAYELILLFNRSHALAIPDALIAATAVTHNLELATDNTRHFSMIPDLLIQRPY
jgi:predicted nucleic acid-binding protein